MASFKNDYCDFVKVYSEEIRKFFSDLNRDFIFIPSDENKFFDYSSTPLGTHPSYQFKDCYPIFYNELLIKELNFSQEEIHACIAHEIGHHIIFLKKDFTEYDEISKEIFCDSICKQLNLQDAMLSALRKMKPIMIESQYNARIKAIQNTEI